MRRFLLDILAAIAFTIAAIVASVTGAHANDVMVMNAFARASATPAAKAGAAYITIANRGAEPDRLVSASTPAARSAQLHRTVMDGDVMKMEPVDALDIPAGGTVEMKPGGVHIMLMGLAAPLKEGDTFELDLGFEQAGQVKVTVPVGSVAAGEHPHGGDDSGG